ncbi:MAG: EamA family transporter, partial [Myxococcota bacterium]|nr:EamA family transporter [Myxococcota bacterium]
MSEGRLAALVSIALVAFAANSILCRLALAADEIDAVSFTAIRIASGALVLGALARRRTLASGNARGALALFGYAIAFSLAYVRIGAATGALLLFGAVQATMLGVAIARGERPGARTWVGLACALGGLVML